MGEEQKVPGLLKTGFFKSAEPAGKVPAGESKFRRVAKFLVLIGSERAAEIISRLPPDQVEAISQEITTIRGIGPEESRIVLEEFSSLLASPYNPLGTSSGGVEAARRVLYAAFGPEKGEQLLVKAVPEAKTNPFDFLEDFSGDQLALLFKEEPPSAAALVFSRLPPKLSAAALAFFTGDKKLEILKRIAKQRSVPPEVLDQVAGALREKARHIGTSGEVEFDGMEVLASILKSSDASFGDGILDQLEAEDPELGKTLKEKIYTLADLLEAEDLPIQKKLSSMNDRDIILLLKARRGTEETTAFREKILSNLSKGRREEILEEEGIIGAVPKKDVDEVSAAFLFWFRTSREDGTLLMMNDEDLVL
jgi:flagellar motor switch protein FliG